MLSCRYIWNQTASHGFESFCVPVYVCVGVCVVRGVVLCSCVFVVASVWWCLCGGGVVVFSCLCDGVCFFFCGGVFTEKCIGVKKISGIKVLPTHAHIHNHIKHFLYSTVFNASHYGEDMQRALATLVYKNIWCKSSPYTAHIHNHIKHVLYSTVFIQLSSFNCL